MAALLRLPAFDRRALMGSSLAWLLSSLAADAEGTELTSDALSRLIDLTLAEADTTPLSRPRIIGFTEERLTTKSIERGDKAHKYGFMVVIPHHEDGLVMFEGKDEKPFFFAIHRTGEHLNRVASARNDNGALSDWSGPEAEDNFASQKAFWATT